MISTDRPRSKKYLPTLNLLDITTAYSWSKMRRIVKDYGKRMTVRHEILLPVIFLYMILVYLFIYLTQFNIIPINEELRKTLNPFLYIDFVVLTLLTLVLLYFAARVNWFYSFHVFKIEKIKKMIKEMYTFREHYFGIDRGLEYSIIKMQDELVF
jgi:succinate dehydrogenase hydrophobic anchor subunit